MQLVKRSLLAAGIMIAAAIGSFPSHVLSQVTTPAAATETEANETLVRRFFEIASRGDLADLETLHAPDFVIRTAPPGEGTSLETLTQTFQDARNGLPDFDLRVDDVIAQEDMVVARITVSGTHLGDFFGSPPTGARIETTAIDVWRVEDGKLAENWHLEDILGVIQQIAAASSAAGATTPSAATLVATPMETNADSDAATLDTAAVEGNVALARRFHDEIFAMGNLDVADEILAPGFVWRLDVPPGAGGVKTFAGDVREAFPDLTLTADEIVAESDRVAILWTLSGTHEGEFLGAPRTGNTISTPGVDIYRIENGKIAEIWTVGDELGLLTQLGASPVFGG